MGVTYSTSSPTETVIKRQSLRLTYFDATRVSETAQKHNFPPITDVNGLHSLFHSAFGYQRISSSEITDLLYMCEKMFKHDDIIYSQEVLVMLILLCDAPWKKRASLLFLVFQGIGTEEMGHEDFILAAQVIAVALCRLWEASMWNPKSLTTLSESIADNAFTKLEKDIDDTVGHDDFVSWAVDRFRDSKTIASSDALKSIYSIPI